MPMAGGSATPIIVIGSGRGFDRPRTPPFDGALEAEDLLDLRPHPARPSRPADAAGASAVGVLRQRERGLERRARRPAGPRPQKWTYITRGDSPSR